MNKRLSLLLTLLLLSVGPAPLELGYYLAVNSGRIVGGKEALLARYRTVLEGGLGHRLDAPTWRRLQALTVLAGANVLLWQKALPFLEVEPPPRARDEFGWWADALAHYW